MAALLRSLQERHRTWTFVRRLLAATPRPVRPREPAPRGRASRPGRPAERPRARRAALLRSDLDGPAIARELGVSLSTVRTHTKHIYAKLGVNNRRAAVRRAHQLNLFSAGR